MNCLGKLSRDSGHMRVPDPPHMITGLNLGIHSPGWRVAIAIASRASSAITAAPRQCADLASDRHDLRVRRCARVVKAMIPVAAAVNVSASANAPNATGKDRACAMAPVMSGAGTRLGARNSE